MLYRLKWVNDGCSLWLLVIRVLPLELLHQNVSVPVISNQDAEEGKDTSARKEKDVKLEAGLDGLRRSKRAIRPEP